ncbi:MAG: invasion associated locus B family protein [Rhodospirillales bacterium]|jgi:invasion protein IalB|nr:invasion associated locus B family protein [Rhodospirillales bacterium]
MGSGQVTFALALVASLAMAGPALAQPQEIGRFGDWTAFTDGSGPKKICFIGSSPKKAEGAYTARGQTYMLITHRPAEKAVGEVSVEAGYAYKAGSDVAADIDGKSFKLFTQGGNAWAQNAQADRALVQALRAGKQLVVKGTSSRGTLTTDTYSLTGFTAAYDAITKACAVN